jgi:putative tryptophan/tyrosine transport system substrate-binding protein
MDRRDFITLLGGAAAVWPLAARAQQPAMPVIGYVSVSSPDEAADRLRALRQGLAATGFVEGKNVAIEYRWAEGQAARLGALYADVVHRQVNVIVASGGASSLLAAKAATTTIPTVFYSGSDPVALGLVDGLSRPGGNMTGVTNLNTELSPKRLELLHELVPKAMRVALLVSSFGIGSSVEIAQLRSTQAAASALGLDLPVLRAASERDFEMTFASLVQSQVGGLVIGSNPLFTARTGQLADLALRHGLPTIFEYREFAAAGGLMSYGGSRTDPFRLMGAYAGRILHGDRPADLPIQQLTKIELVINLKTAQALGLTFPLTLLGRADEVIE